MPLRLLPLQPPLPHKQRQRRPSMPSGLTMSEPPGSPSPFTKNSNENENEFNYFILLFD
jgi:hypothetical protein